MSRVNSAAASTSNQRIVLTQPPIDHRRRKVGEDSNPRTPACACRHRTFPLHRCAPMDRKALPGIIMHHEAKIRQRGPLEMNDTVMTKPQFDRTVEDLGNIVELGHVNVTVPDQSEGSRFLPDGPWPDPRSVPDGGPREHVGQCRPRPVPSADAQPAAGGARHDGAGGAGPGGAAEAAATTPRSSWKAPSSATSRSATWSKPPARGATVSACTRRTRKSSARCASACRMSKFDIPAGTDLDKIAQFYNEILGGIAGVAKDERGPYAWASCSGECKVIYRESKTKHPGIRRPPHPDHARRLLRPAQEAAGAWPDHRGKRPAPVSLPRYRRCGYQQAAVPDRARDAQHAPSDVQPHLRQPQPGHEQPQLRAGYEVGIWALA